MKRISTHTLSAALLALLAAGGVHAQVYRIVGPDGRVTFSDKPPVDTGAKTAAVSTNASAGGESSSLPYALRQISQKYPVTLYTSSTCGPCGTGRSMLASRGIPFAEKTVNTNDDAEALQRLSGDLTVPFLTIGGQQIKGYSETEWTQFLDAAGYPKTSQLPSGYRNPPAAPLVAAQRPTTPAANPDGQGAQAAQNGAAPLSRGMIQRAPVTTAPRPANSDNPAGISF